jgi:hypothetical protein
MVHIRRTRVRSTVSTPSPGRRKARRPNTGRWAAVVLSVAGAFRLVCPQGPQCRQGPVCPQRNVAVATHPAPSPGPVVPDSSTPKVGRDSWLDDPNAEPGPLDENSPDAVPTWPPLTFDFNRVDRVTGPGGTHPQPGTAEDPGTTLRAPAAGSSPSASPPPLGNAQSAAPVANHDRWQFLRRSATGQSLFLSGFLLLLLSIGGLVSVGLYRRRW